MGESDPEPEMQGGISTLLQQSIIAGGSVAVEGAWGNTVAFVIVGILMCLLLVGCALKISHNHLIIYIIIFI